MKFQRWKDKTKIFYKRKILPANLQIREDLTPKQIHDTAKLEAYAKLVSFEFLKMRFYQPSNWHKIFIPGFASNAKNILSQATRLAQKSTIILNKNTK